MCSFSEQKEGGLGSLKPEPEPFESYLFFILQIEIKDGVLLGVTIGSRLQVT